MVDSINLGALLGSVGGGAGADAPAQATRPLFGALLASSGDARNIRSADKTGLGFLANFNISNGIALPQLDQANPSVLLMGEAEAIQLLAARITALTQKLTEQGGFQFGAEGAQGDLAAALTKLGLPAAQAQDLAARIDSMLTLLQQQAGVEREQLAGEAGTGLSALLLAAFLSPNQAATLQLPAQGQAALTNKVSAGQTQIQIELIAIPEGINQASWQAAQMRAQAATAAGLLQADIAKTSGATTPSSAATMVMAVKVQVVASIQQVTSNQDETINQGANSNNPIIIVPLPLVGSAQPMSAEKILSEVLGMPAPETMKGDVLYRLTEQQPGSPLLQALKEMPAINNDVVPTPQVILAAVAQNQPAISQIPGGAGALAERLYQAQQAQVGQQVQIAIQPLLQNGQGGNVRMTLNPPELGKIEIHLKVEGGQVQGSIAAHEPAVIEHLVRELPTLRQSLLDAGLKLGDQGLSLMLNNQQNPQQQSAQNPFAGFAEGQGQRSTGQPEAELGTTSANELLTATIPGRWIAPTQLVDVAA
jgi:flagellar hook-length control protein FliK